MISGNKALAVVYSGDGAYIMSENEDLGFLMPEEGTNLWYDAMVMTRDCENTELAYEFMDFMLRDDVAYRNTQYVGYSSPVVAAYEQAQEEEVSRHMYRVSATKKMKFSVIRIRILRNYLLSFGPKSRHSKLKGLLFYSG